MTNYYELSTQITIMTMLFNVCYDVDRNRNLENDPSVTFVMMRNIENKQILISDIL